jgi:hypothetical protein
MTRTYTPIKRADDYSLLRADWEFLASACSNALWGDDRYRDMRRGAFLNAVRNKLREPERIIVAAPAPAYSQAGEEDHY